MGAKDMSKKVINEYLSDIHSMFSGGDAREESYYSILASLLEKMWKINFQGKPSVIITPKSTEAVKPDVVIKDNKSRIVGYIEAKAPSKHLDQVVNSTQLKRYCEVFPNLLLTNFLEFRHFREGHLIKSIKLAEPEDLFKATPPACVRIKELRAFFEEFLEFENTYFTNYRRVAEELARQTRFMRDDVVLPELLKNEKEDPGVTDYTRHLHGLFRDFKACLIHGLSKREFADLYSQTFTFGIFTAAATHKGQCDLRLIGRLIPPTNGLLRVMFHIIEMGIVPPQLESCLEHILDIFNKSRPDTTSSGFIDNILISFIRDPKWGTVHPVIHFYETFLSAYDPGLRQRKGVYYTPEPVVGFIVRSIHKILKKKLDKPDGLADKDIKILDPAAGTGTFPAFVTNIILNEYRRKYGKGAISGMARDYLLKNLFAFEGMMAPYAVGHWRMAHMLQKEGIPISSEEHFKLLITNTLTIGNIEQSPLPGMSFIADESRKADIVKTKTPVTVVLGNPPYAGHSTNPGKVTGKVKGKDAGTWIGDLIEDYKKIDGQSLGEKNPKWLQDDYVKFIRFAQHMIDKNNLGEGVVGFVTNHAYLDNPTFRGMRRSLMKSFDEIYILDLHGNKSKKEKSPDGSADENVFDIRQGVAISLFIKTKGKHKHKGCRIFHADLYGNRKDKYVTLGKSDIFSIQWQEIVPDPEFFLFTRGGNMDRAHYSSFVKITDIFPVHNVGIVTARDKLTIKDSKQEIWSTVNRFATCGETQARSLFDLGPDSRDWQVKEARQDLMASGPEKKRIAQILYRPFDLRYTYYTGKSRGFLCMPRPDIMPHMLKNNIGLITVRQVAEGVFNHSLVADTIVESRVTTSNKGIAYLFPLYLYLFPWPVADTAKHLNLEPRYLKRLAEIQGFPSQPNPEDVFYYIYGILFSNRYRETYAEGLKIDFPRIPMPPSFKLFKEMANLGRELADLHLMPENPGDSGSRFEVTGSNLVKKISYNTSERKVFINRSQYFSKVEPESWNYKLCGYQVLGKWLAMRKGRVLNGDDIGNYLNMIHIIHFTRILQHRIDLLYPPIDEKVSGP